MLESDNLEENFSYEDRRRSPKIGRVYGENRHPYTLYQAMQRASSPNRSVEILVSYLCYGIWQMESPYLLDPFNQAYLTVENWWQLNDNDKRLVRPDNMERALQSLLQTLLRLLAEDQRFETENQIYSNRQVQNNQEQAVQPQIQLTAFAQRPKLPRNTNAIPEPKKQLEVEE